MAGGGGGPGITATGGQSTYVYGGKKIHVWTTTGAASPFDVTSAGTSDNEIELSTQRSMYLKFIDQFYCSLIILNNNNVI